MTGDLAHGTAADSTDPVARGVARARGILPDQGPIGVFVHHNTLHAFQHLPFHQGVQQGARFLAARPYLDVHEFRAAFAKGRIEAADVDAAIARTLGDRAQEPLPLGLTRHALWRALLLDVLDEDDAPGLAFGRAHGAAGLHGSRLVPAALDRARRTPRPPATEGIDIGRHRDALVALDAEDTDVVVHGELIRLSYVFLDHGQALAEMPHRHEGFLAAVEHLYASGSAEVGVFAGVRDDLLRVLTEGLTARQVIDECLAALGAAGDDIEPLVLATALALPGWTGMFSRLERHPEEHEGDGSVALLDFLAVRLVHERRAVETACGKAGLPARWAELRALALAARPHHVPERDAWVLAGLADAAGATSSDVAALLDADLRALWAEVAALPDVRRRQVLHDAYERRYRRQILDGMAALRPEIPAESGQRPDAQFVFCIDEREESLRRAIEELSPRYETFGVAGFFGVAIDYQGLYDDAPAAYCPVVVTPAHEVHEAPLDEELHWHVRRSGLRDRWRTASRLVHRHSRTLGGGAGLSFVLGPLAAAMALTRVVAPRSSLALRASAVDRFAPRPGTRLLALREPDAPGAPTPSGKPVGFALDEAVDRVAGTLRNIGMVEQFAPVVFILGHGSSSLNNPHESAHDCGACGGRRGGANARLFAEFANDPAVRTALAARGLHVPDDTWFVGGLHDTSSDDVTLYDLERLPAAHAEPFQRAEDALDLARRESAAERCRRFDDAPLGLSADDALRHVQARASHLAQPRPEYGHCTNAIAVVGRRRLTRGLHLDRRPFLVSYDPRRDENHAILERILAAVGPVGAGISLEYYFSSVDNERFGCGTKLPHNVTGLIGVMSGHQSDLRTGLPLQMVEIHEPMRLLLIVDATPDALLAVAGRQAEVAELVVNEWVQLVSCDPETGAMMIFEDGAFVAYAPARAPLPRVRVSRDWHMQGRGHLPPALVSAALIPVAPDARELANV
jgi:uncharacterized protein YbcC (UPF0753/DUF2309 family)